MLIETPYKDGDTVSYNQSSRQEIVDRLDKEEADYYTLKKPMVLIAQEKGLGLAPFMFSVNPDGKFLLRANSVSCVSKTQDEISKQYIATTSGIVTT